MSLRLGVWIALVPGVLGAGVSQASAAVEYSVTDLGSLGGTNAEAKAINESGQVTGSSVPSGGAHYHAFLWTPGGRDGVPGNRQMKDLHQANWLSSEGNGINESGQVAGGFVIYFADSTQRYRPFISSAGQIQVLGVLGGEHSFGHAINGPGQVTGISSVLISDVEYTHAFIYSGGVMSDLGRFPGTHANGYDTISYGRSINDGGQITGTAFFGNQQADSSGHQAFLYDHGARSYLGTLGGLGSDGYAINSSGQVTGTAQRDGDGSLNTYRAFLWTPGGTDGVEGNPQMKSLGPLSPEFQFTVGLGINDSGQVVGFAQNSSADKRAIIYDTQRGVLDLNTLIQPNSGWVLAWANDINNQGQIVGLGVHNGQGPKAFLLGPPAVPAKLRALEVTQVIQDWNNSVPLIKGKRTFARLYLESTRSQDDNKRISPQLHGFRNGTELPGSPLTPYENRAFNSLNTNSESYRGDLVRNSGHFELPEAWTSGTIQLRPEAPGIEIETMVAVGAPASTSVSITFTNVPRPRIAIIPLEVANAFYTEVAAPDIPTITSAMLRTRRLYPADELDWQLWETSTVPSTGLPTEWLALMSGEHLLHPSTISERRVILGVLRPEGLRTNSSFFSGIGVPIIRAGLASVGGSDPRDVVSHELGHIYGRSHAVHQSFGQDTIWGILSTILYKRGPCGERAGLFAEDFPYFFDVACAVSHRRPTIGPMDLGEPLKIYGFSREPSGGSKIVDPKCYYEVMGYCSTDNDWISDWNYEALLAKFVELYGSAPANAPLSRGSPGPSGPQPLAECVLVSGIVDFGTGTVSWQPVQCLPYTTTPPATPPGDFLLKSLDQSGAVLGQVSFDATIPEDTELSETNMPAPFALTFPMDAAARQLAIYYQQTNLLSTITGSSNLPTVHVLSPNGGELVGTNGLEIQWEATDGDGDALTFYVFYSANQGVTWRTLGMNWPTNRLTVRCEDICGSTQALVRVQVSDGFYCAADQSDGIFTVPDKGPVIVLAEPTSNAVFYADQNVTAEAIAVDREDGVLSDSQMEWSSDRSGILGTGKLLMVSAQPLALGDHVLTCVARDSRGNSNQVSVTITVVSPPIIMSQPLGRADNPGTTATFTVAASGSSPLSYQWTKNGTNLSDSGSVSGATTTNLTLTGVSQSDAAGYAVVVTNSYGSVTSAVATLIVNLPPGITTQPQSQTVAVGSNVNFSVTAAGTPLLDYQWTYNGSNIPGATASSFLLTNAQPTNAGDYAVVVSNFLGTVTSSNAVLAVHLPPSISVQPQSQTGLVGSNVMFSVVAGGTGPLNYQWTFNGANISGATSSNYAKSNLQFTNAGNYGVVVGNTVGSATSSNAYLTVHGPASVTVRLRMSTIKPGTESVQLVNNGDFQFQGPLAGTNYPSPNGWSSSVDIYANAGSNLVAVNSGIVARAQVNSGAPASGINQTVRLEPATAYVFSGYLWNMGNSTDRVTAVADMNDVFNEPQLSLRFSDAGADQGYFVYRTFNTGDTGTNLNVRVFYDTFTGTGTAAAYYPVAAQWDNIAITRAANFAAPQASGSPATLRPLVRITSPANGSIINASAAALAITAEAVDLDGTITNVQFFAGAAKVAEITANPWTAYWSNATPGYYVLTAIAADNTGATTLSAPVSVSITVPRLGHRYSFTTDASDSIGSAHGQLLGGATVSGGAVVLNGSGAYVNLPNNLVTGLTAITIEAWLVNNGSGDWARIFDFGNNSAGEGNAGTGTQYMFLTPGPGPGALRFASTQNGGGSEQRISAPALANGAQKHVVLATDGTMALGRLYVDGVLVGSNAAMTLTPTALGPTVNNWIGRAQFSGNAFLNATMTEFRIWETALTAEDIAANFQAGPDTIAAGGPLTIRTQPQSQTVPAGSNVTFSVTATGPEPLSYQWRFANTNLPAATNTSLVLSGVTSYQAGPYRVMVSNFSGSVTSDVATLTIQVNGAPILAAISDRIVHAGSAIIFTNSATDPETNALTFSLGAGAPPEATIDPANGVFNWLTADANVGGTSDITVRVTDDGSPPASDAKTFSVTVVPRIVIQSIVMSNESSVTFTWNSIAGATYRAQYKTNLAQVGWIDLAPTITAAGSTTSRSENIIAGAERYYRISLMGY